MDIIDFILNLAGLLLWLNWRTFPFDTLNNAGPVTLLGTLRRAGGRNYRRWHFAAMLGALLLLRAGFYRLIGPAVNWTGSLDLIATQLAFRSDSLNLMLLYSGLSFAQLLVVFVLGLLLLSVVSPGGNPRPWLSRLEHAHLGFVVGWPVWRKLLLPFVVCLALWWLCSWPLAWCNLIPRPGSETSRLAQSALIGLSSYFAWKYPIVALLTAYLLHNYLYLGRPAFGNFVNDVARRLLGPLRPLRVGRVDLAPLVGVTLVLLLAQFAEHGLRPETRFDSNGRPEAPAWEIPGLRGLFERVSQ